MEKNHCLDPVVSTTSKGGQTHHNPPPFLSGLGPGMVELSLSWDGDEPLFGVQ